MRTRKSLTVVLASASPRRKDLFALLGLDFQIGPADVIEDPLPSEPGPDYVLRLAEKKARWAAARQNADVVIVAADTTVVDNSQILGKPSDSADAERMLHTLRGNIHQVFSGIAVKRDGELIADICGTDVSMRQYSDQEIHDYINSGDPMDKAGAYAIQHAGFHPVKELQGCFANVMGLPLCHLTRALRKLGVEIGTNVPKVCQEYVNYICTVYRSFL